MKKRLLAGLGTLTFAVLLAACSSLPVKLLSSKQAAQPRADAEGSLQVSGLTRLYDLHVPSSYTSEKPVPLVLAFHGAGGNGKAMEQLTELSQLAEQTGFIVVYPDAIDQHWDARRRSQPETSHDIDFISALIDQVGQEYNLDRSRIYATGFSNGGMFAHRVACELSDKVAASAAVAATMPENLSRTCQPAQPISMLLMHGTNDPVVPYGEPGRALLSLADTMKFWSSHDRCSPQAVKTTLPQAPNVSLETYQQCANDTTVMLYTIEAGEHSWPNAQSGTIDKPNQPSRQIDASTIIWEFFSQHSAKSN